MPDRQYDSPRLQEGRSRKPAMVDRKTEECEPRRQRSDQEQQRRAPARRHRCQGLRRRAAEWETAAEGAAAMNRPPPQACRACGCARPGLRPAPPAAKPGRRWTSETGFGGSPPAWPQRQSSLASPAHGGVAARGPAAGVACGATCAGSGTGTVARAAFVAAEIEFTTGSITSAGVDGTDSGARGVDSGAVAAGGVEGRGPAQRRKKPPAPGRPPAGRPRRPRARPRSPARARSAPAR